MNHNSEKQTKVIRLSVSNEIQQSNHYNCNCCSEKATCYSQIESIPVNDVINLKRIEINKMVSEVSALTKREE